MSLHQAFVQELSQLNRGFKAVHCLISDEAGQTVVLAKAGNGEKLTVALKLVAK